MAKKTTYRVEHDGVVFTRTTARVYRYVVLRPVSLAALLDQADDGVHSYLRINREYYQEMAAGRCESWQRFPELYPPERIAEEIAGAQAWLAKPLAERLAEARQRAESHWRKQHGERAESWTWVGWCGRLDLAQKLANPGDVILPVFQPGEAPNV